MSAGTFVSKNSLEKRKDESAKILAKYPDRVPVIVERAEKGGAIASIDKSKFLVPADLTVGQMVYVIRRRLALSPETAIFVFVNNQIPPTSALMSSLYENQKAEDGFLYVEYSAESTFG